MPHADGRPIEFERLSEARETPRGTELIFMPPEPAGVHPHHAKKGLDAAGEAAARLAPLVALAMARGPGLPLRVTIAAVPAGVPFDEPPRVVVAFVQGDFEDAWAKASLAEAQAFSEGVCTGCDYGERTCSFVLPDDEAEMVRTIRDPEQLAEARRTVKLRLEPPATEPSPG